MSEDKRCVIKVGAKPDPDCPLEAGATVRFVEHRQPEPESVMSKVPVTVTVPIVTVPVVKVPVATSDEALDTSPVSTETVGVADEITAVTDAAADLGPGQAPWVVLIVSALAVFGGAKAWGYYRQRANQKHELAMKKMDLDAKGKGLGSTVPPACIPVHTKLTAQIAETNTEVENIKLLLTTVTRRSLLTAELDPEDIERQFKRLGRRIQDLEDVLEDV